MSENSSRTNLVTKFAIFGLAVLTSGGWWQYRRRRPGSLAAPSGSELVPEEGKGVKGASGAENPQEDDRLHNPIAPPKPQRRSVLEYILLVFVLSIPLWLFGRGKLPLAIDLPVSSLIWINPVLAASILTYRQAGKTGLKDIWKKAFDLKKIPNQLWIIPGLFLMPLIYSLSYGIMRLVGMPLPRPDFPWLVAPVFFLMFFITATGEELGWTGFATDPLQNRWGALKASLLLGVIWGVWHLIGDVQNHRTPGWILWHRLSAVALRVLIVWIYNHTGKSVFAAILLHATDNVSWSLFPNYGSHYNPFVNSLISWLAAAIAIIGWGFNPVARSRFAGAGKR